MLGIVSLTGCGTSDDKPEKEDKKVEEKSTKDLSSYKGVWKTNDDSVPNEELIINSIDDKKINFDLIIYKLTSFDNVSAEIKDGVATFDTKNSIYLSLICAESIIHISNLNFNLKRALKMLIFSHFIISLKNIIVNKIPLLNIAFLHVLC